MKNILVLGFVLFFTASMMSQVGIGTLTPTAELEINTTNTGIPALELTPQTNPTGNITGQLAVIGDLLYMYDSVRVKWLSVDSTPLQFGQNGNQDNTRISFGGNLRNNNSGAPMAFDGTIIAIAITSNGTLNKAINLRINGTNVADSIDPTLDGQIVLASGSFSSTTYNLDFNAGDYLSMHISSADGLGDINAPSAIIWIKERK